MFVVYAIVTRNAIVTRSANERELYAVLAESPNNRNRRNYNRRLAAWHHCTRKRRVLLIDRVTLIDKALIRESPT
jgi:hypothetical protein